MRLGIRASISSVRFLTVLASLVATPWVLPACSSASPEQPPLPTAPDDDRPAGRDPAPSPGGAGEGKHARAVPTDCAPSMQWKPFAFGGEAIDVSPDDDLQAAIDAAPDGAILALAAGDYVAKPKAYADPTCGNCGVDDPKKPDATTGFVVRGKSIAIRGAGRDKTRLVTNAGYGVLVEDACELRLEAVDVTGGARDPDGDAADGALVARRSRVALVDSSIAKNTALLPNGGYPGIAGVMCREASDVLVLRSEIDDNSWDGVAVYRGGHVRVVGSTIRKGNGAAVGVTWDGRAKIVASDLSKYWKGVGSFQDAKVEVYATFVRENLGWGLWAADRGELVAVNDTIVYNDQLGVYLATDTTKGKFVNNLVAYNGASVTGAFEPTTFGRGGIRGFSPTTSPFTIASNVLYDNDGGDWIAADATSSLPPASWGNTNVAADPKLVSRADPTPSASSPLLEAGDPAIKNPDGSRSNVGATGGPYAGATQP